MPKIRSPKTKKSVSRRFKITATGKVLRHRAGRRHLMANKSGKRASALSRAAVVHETDAYRITQSMPFSHRG